MKKILLASLCFISYFNVATVWAETPKNYAYGARLSESNSGNMFSFIQLNFDVYTQTLSEQLDDVRIFNRNGQPVPFSLINVYEQQNKQTQTFPMRIYLLNEASRRQTTDDREKQYQIKISGKNLNINIDDLNTNDANYTATYLLQSSDDIPKATNINRLALDFEKQSLDKNWQAFAHVFYSDDLSSWKLAVKDIPIMNLRDNNNQRFKLDSIDMPSRYHYTAHNWLITLQSQQPIPKVKNVYAEMKNEDAKIALYPIDFTLTSSDSQQAIYQLTSPQPTKALSIKLANIRTVLPMSISYKVSEDDKAWQHLGNYIIRRTNYDDEPQRITFQAPALNIKQLQIKALNSSFDEAPTITDYRDRMNIIFNSANNGPFILAWGSASAKSASLSPQALLSNSTSITTIPEVYIGENVTLAGKQALISAKETDIEKSSGFPRWVIWSGLIIGAALLVMLALKLAKEIKKAQ